MSRVGIFSGTFDPVHKGHVAFALEAIKSAGLDKVCFLPERMPRQKDGVTHYAHRVAMLRLAIKPYRKLELLELPDKQFSVKQTLPRLKRRFAHSELCLMIGSDTVPRLAEGAWSDSERLLSEMSLIVGMRIKDDLNTVTSQLELLTPKKNFEVVSTDNKHASSSEIRLAMTHGSSHPASLSSLEEYIKQNWLYVSVELNNS